MISSNTPKRIVTVFHDDCSYRSISFAGFYLFCYFSSCSMWIFLYEWLYFVWFCSLIIYFLFFAAHFIIGRKKILPPFEAICFCFYFFFECMPVNFCCVKWYIPFISNRFKKLMNKRKINHFIQLLYNLFVFFGTKILSENEIK